MDFKKPLYFLLGATSFSLGFIGAVVPVVPTTPFILLAAFCFSKSSEKFHNRLLSSKLFGPMIRDWQNGHVIRLRAKILATVLMTAMLSYPLFFRDFGIEFKFLIAVICGCVLIFIWSCPLDSSDPLNVTAQTDKL